MTASFVPGGVSSRRSTGLSLVLGLAGIVVFLGLVLAGLTFFALAIAFPIAVPLAESIGVPVSAHDASIASSLSGVTWVFIVASVASFAAGLGVLGLSVRSFSRAAEDGSRA